MVLIKKQIEELEYLDEAPEEFHRDSTEETTTTQDDSAESSLAWRRSMIEKAAQNVRKATQTIAEANAEVPIGSLVFDKNTNRFGRVLGSKPGLLTLTYVTGGTSTIRDLDCFGFVKEHRHRLTLSEMAKKLFLSEKEVISLLNQIELTSEPPIKKHAKVDKVKGAKEGRLKKISFPNPQKKKKASGKPTKVIALKAGKKEPPKKGKASKSKSIQWSPAGSLYSPFLPAGATTDPIADPNGYIRQNFQMMSNKKLALITGLSEHTIRRKLGEWHLKRDSNKLP